MRIVPIALWAVLAIAGCGKKEPAAAPVEAKPKAVLQPIKSGPAWELIKSKDEMTDEPRTVAQISPEDAPAQSVLSIRCDGKRLEVLAIFDQYLGNDSRPVKYRLDQNSPQDETWSVSSKGTAVFASESADFARQLMSAKKLVIEAADFRDVRHRAVYSWESGVEKIGEVLEACGRQIVGLDSKIPGLRKATALEVERWGPKNIETKKRALAAIAGYKGEVNEQLTPDFALAVQAFGDDYAEKCKAGKVRGPMCDTMKILAGMNSEMRQPVGPMIYEQAPKAIQKDMGNLRIND